MTGEYCQHLYTGKQGSRRVITSASTEDSRCVGGVVATTWREGRRDGVRKGGWSEGGGWSGND